VLLYNATKDDIKIIDSGDFDKIIQRINAISETDYADIIEILEDFKVYNDDVNTNIEAEDYSQNSTPEMENRIVELFNNLFAWLNKFEI
jgi:hypothetical protein